jgi:hypothetical protein
MRKILVLMAMLLLVANTAMADNIRPFQPPTGDLNPLQAIFTGIGSSIDVDTDQISPAYFVPTGFGSSAAAFIAQVTWAQFPGSFLEFGLYELGNPNNTVTVIPGGVNPLTSVNIQFNFVAGTVTTRDAITGTQIDTASFTSPFGFYTYTEWNNTGFLYSDDSLNPSGSAQQLIYKAKGENVSLPYPTPVLNLNDIGHFYVACEALAINGALGTFAEGAFDFNDMVVMLESVQPVPLPGAVLLLGAGLARLAAYARRRQD